jgi:hypothetical protein
MEEPTRGAGDRDVPPGLQHQRARRGRPALPARPGFDRDRHGPRPTGDARTCSGRRGSRGPRGPDRRLAASRDAPEDRVPTLVAALEEADPGVHAAALREIEREPRAVAAMLLLPIVEGRAGAADRPGAARILARHFRAFDFPGDERDATDRRLFAAIAAGLIGDADARSRWMDVLAAMFHVGTEADVRHEAAGRAGDIARSLGATLDPATARELRRVLEAAAPRDPRARTLAAWF